MEWCIAAPSEHSAHNEGTINEGARRFWRHIFCTFIPKRVLERVQGCYNGKCVEVVVRLSPLFFFFFISLPSADKYLYRKELLNETKHSSITLVTSPA